MVAKRATPIFQQSLQAAEDEYEWLEYLVDFAHSLEKEHLVPCINGNGGVSGISESNELTHIGNIDDFTLQTMRKQAEEVYHDSEYAAIFADYCRFLIEVIDDYGKFPTSYK